MNLVGWSARVIGGPWLPWSSTTRFRFVSLLDPVDPRLLTDLVDEGVVPVAIRYDVAAAPLAAEAVQAEALLRMADLVLTQS